MMIPGISPMVDAPVGQVPIGPGRRFASRVGLAAPVSARAIPRAFLDATAAPARLYATGHDPVTAAANEVHAALAACEDAIDSVGTSDEDLREAFEFARKQLDLAARMTADTTVTHLQRVASLPVGASRHAAITDTPRLQVPVNESREELYGLRATLRGALSFLADAVRDLSALHRRGASVDAALPVLGLIAVSATRLIRIADVVVAHLEMRSSPHPPELPGIGGDVELYSAGRATPQRRAAMRARVRFTPGRVEITTAQGKFSIGQASAIGMLLWVAPGVQSALEQVMDPSESWTAQPEVDGLGTVHILDTSGRSLAALELVDWASQPSTVVDQALVDSSAGEVALGAARGIYALESLGFARGAATIGVPLRRGLAHPPAAETSMGLLRPSPQRQPYLGRDATPANFAARRHARRRWFNRDLGPTASYSWITRPLLPYFVALAPLFIWPGGGRSVVQIAFAIATLLMLAEPFVSWAWPLVRDLDVGARPVARYRAGGGLFAPRLELRGRDLVMTSRSGHRTRLPGPGDGDLGITRILRLRWQGQVWGFALADDRWRWRAVLPAAEWTADPRAEGLENFARVVGLAVAEQDAPVLPRLEQETAAPGLAAASRSFGVPARGLIILGIFASPAAALSLTVGPSRSLWLSVVELVATFGAAAAFSAVAKMRLRRAPVA